MLTLVVNTSTSSNPPVTGNRLSRELIRDLSSYAADLYVHRKCRIAPDGTRLSEGFESPKISHRSSNSILVAQTNIIRDQKQSAVPVAVADPTLGPIRVH